MRVLRLSPWITPDGVIPAGAEVEMSDDLARVHIAHGSAEVIAEVVAPTPVSEPLPPAEPPKPRRR